jgi:N-acetylmuramoyl-L-alanine amidase
MGSISVKGDDSYDYVNIALDEKVAYRTWMDINPSRIFLDIYGVQSNTSWITQLRSAKEIEHVYYNQPEDDVVRLTIQLKHKQHWGYSAYYQNNSLCLKVKRQSSSVKAKQLYIAIDAGHGGVNNGAVGVTTKGLEKTYTLRFANELEKYLKKKGASVLMTRTSDTTLNDLDRVALLREAQPDLLISLHLNSSLRPDVKGASSYYKSIGFKPLTTALLNRLLQLELSEFGNVGNFNYALSNLTDFPSALLEIAFLTNTEDEKKISNPRFQRAVARKIYKGLRDWVKMVRE